MHPDWTYQPKPKRRRMGQGTTWLYAVTESTRGGRISRCIKTFDHCNGTLVFPTPEPGGADGSTSPQIGNVMTLPVPQVQPTHPMYVNTSQAIPPGAMRFPSHLPQRGGLLSQGPNGAMYLNQSGQPVIIGGGG
uniref:Uncharacterized protein n=1 Tax=Ciona savignyi TaxID=51511 RepID=H2YLU0_CIOSA